MYLYNNGEYFMYDGVTGALRNVGIENGTARPSAPFKGQVFIDTINKQIWYDSAQWRDVMGNIV
ncbi:hypothetical protein [Peribacillus sp. FSL E2-0159]|uniref:hypothetical protein n=1 Tax=Peribacillus sp. FSL E2-0159 TaxID=2975289 RepID=UPI00315A9386